jgi:hypothetical protein
MTDLEKFKECYKQFGIELIVNKEKGMYSIYLEGMGEDNEITRDDRLCAGYSGFCSEIRFSLDGKFIEQGFYE